MDYSALAQGFLDGKILLFDKPLYWTSFDLVRKVKNILRSRLQLKKIKVGHAGTLDPLASGLMIVCTGRETRNIEKYQAGYKNYKAVITLGATTPSFDLETDIDARFPTGHITREAVLKVLSDFTGLQVQKPPVYSARLVEGKRAYTLARKGQEVELAGKEIVITKLELLRFELPVIEVFVTCSKGTYIRSLARDIGVALDSGAHLTGLVRTAIGDFSLHQAMKVEEFERNLVLL